MIEAFWIPLLPPYLIGLVLSFAVEALLTPRPVAPWRRPMAAVGVHVGVWTLAFALELMLFRRPYFAVANVLAIELLIVLVSNAKFQALREPFVYPDFEYFLDAVKHPRLYLPFFGVWRAVASAGGYGIALWAGLTVEDSLTAGAGLWLASFTELAQEESFHPPVAIVPFFMYLLGLAIIGVTVSVFAGRRNQVIFDAGADLQRLGLTATFWAYALSERNSLESQRMLAPFYVPETGTEPVESHPDLVVIQSESFCDVRNAYPHLVRENLMPNFDLLMEEAVMHGRLKVAAWGANTVRTEFAFLSGMDSQALNVHQYNPYRKLPVGGFPTIASYLKSIGYRTVCVHPYHRSFYRRDQVLPKLGFDEFIGIEAFREAVCEGAYVGDQALAEWIIQFLNEPGKFPVYIHVITMENHGPLHWESVNEDDVEKVLQGPMPKHCEDLVAYSRHLQNADAMFGMVRQALKAHLRPAALCLFGDHVPIMPSVYKSIGELDGCTDYVIWSNNRETPTCQRDLPVTSLAAAFLKGAGVKEVMTPH